MGKFYNVRSRNSSKKEKVIIDTPLLLNQNEIVHHIDALFERAAANERGGGEPAVRAVISGGWYDGRGDLSEGWGNYLGKWDWKFPPPLWE